MLVQGLLLCSAWLRPQPHIAHPTGHLFCIILHSFSRIPLNLNAVIIHHPGFRLLGLRNCQEVSRWFNKTLGISKYELIMYTNVGPRSTVSLIRNLNRRIKAAAVPHRIDYRGIWATSSRNWLQHHLMKVQNNAAGDCVNLLLWLSFFSMLSQGNK